MLHYSPETLRHPDPATKELIAQNMDLINASDNGSLISTGSMVGQPQEKRFGIMLVGEWKGAHGTPASVRMVTSFDLKSGEIRVTPFVSYGGNEAKPVESRPAEANEARILCERAAAADSDMSYVLNRETLKLIANRYNAIQSEANRKMMELIDEAGRVIRSDKTSSKKAGL
jgi:hypothetical protein